MKKIFILLVAVLCTVTVAAQKLPKIKGSGIVELKEVSITEPFNAINIDGDIDIELIQGDENGYSIETDDNLIEVVQFGVADSTLSVSLTHRITKKKKFNVLIKTSDLSGVELNNGAQLESNKKLTGSNLNIIAGKSAKFDLDIDYTNTVAVSLSLDASGDLESNAKNTKFQLTDRSSLKVSATSDSLSMNVTDYSKLTMSGSATNAQINIKDNAKLLSKDTSLNTVEINLKDKAEGTVNVKENITLYAKDTSTLQLYGDANITVSGLKNKAKILKKE